jgi:hypothetical protein
MNSTLSPVRRLGATLLIAGIAAFGSVAVAPAASAEEPAVVQEAPVAEPSAEAPAVADGKDKDKDKPVKAPKFCTDKDLEKHAKDSAKWNEQASTFTALAGKSREAAAVLREKSANLKPGAKMLAELLARGLDKAATALDGQAQKLVDQVALGLQCVVAGAPRF